MSKRKSPYDALQSVLYRETHSSTRGANTTKIIYHGEVIDNDDPENKSRIKVYIEDIDIDTKKNKERLPWCQYFFGNNIHHIPKIGEKIAVILENPWEKVQGRWWIGPILDNRNVSIPLDSVAISGRFGNVVECLDNNDINIKTNSSATSRHDIVNIFMDDKSKKINIDADEVVLSSTNSGESEIEYSLPYGERLVELLDFILEILMTHQHPPNAAPNPTYWFEKANSYKAQLKSWLLNNKVRHKGHYES